ncbi:MAG TPA: NAD(P)/FAD-dependent oxidoreductase [Steroidobacteraceae bacterium]|jgi:protoporphyrinogen oxidase|nr:NAD(P)/FAD-dependent oxidoreductase [Steroidobacteraceae bacterium]
MSDGKIAVIAGAGPAGLTAALELLRQSNIKPIVFEAEAQVGGISKTIEYRGNRMDLGGHRFFSKSDWVMRWWQDILPVAQGQMQESGPLHVHYQGESREWTPAGLGPASSDAVMLVRRRLSRIFYRRRFFNYPLTLSAGTVKNLGLIEAMQIGLSYGQAQLKFRSPQITLEDFLINRFGARLYRTFFKSYTEKVWGVPCQEISAEWGAQRIKGLSVTKALAHALASPFRNSADAAQKQTETSLIERFLYPKFGPGQMWEEVARRVAQRGGEIHLRHRIAGVEHDGTSVTAVDVLDASTGLLKRIQCDYFISSMPVHDLIALLRPADSQVERIAGHLPYRDFMTVGLLLRRMNSVTDRRDTRQANGMPPDNWIYIQEPDVRIGRLQVFNNWSPALVADPATIWLGLEYFCREGDDLWSMDDGRFIDFAASELEKIGLINRKEVIDGTVVRVPKAYPAYFGTYGEFGKVRAYLDRFSNLYPVGRNGMHRYNNQDHSMLAANNAVGCILNNGSGRSDIWRVNAEDEYHEQIGEST